jgi:hypothetical protein
MQLETAIKQQQQRSDDRIKELSRELQVQVCASLQLHRMRCLWFAGGAQSNG